MKTIVRAVFLACASIVFGVGVATALSPRAWFCREVCLPGGVCTSSNTQCNVQCGTGNTISTTCAGYVTDWCCDDCHPCK
jgi:hypothetical protein